METPLKCLCVDDEPLALEVMRALIAGQPALKLISTAANALEAMEKIRQEKPDLIFCDINMPGINGLDFARAIADQECAIIFSPSGIRGGSF